jgi:hypothetical protein
MTRLILLVILAIVTWYYFPETRVLLLQAAEPVILPIQRWSTREEMTQVGRHVVDHERLTGQVPAGREWLGWLEYRYLSADITRDPWGSVYQLTVWQDSIGIVSLGPDRMRLTEDDFHIVTPRE